VSRNPATAAPAPKMKMRRALSDPALLGKGSSEPARTMFVRISNLVARREAVMREAARRAHVGQSKI